MPLSAPEFQQITRSLWLWQLYDPAVKADLYTTAVQTAEGLVLIDPIPLEPEALEDLIARREVAKIVVTNRNHERASGWFAEKFAATILTRQPQASELGAEELRPGNFAPDLTAIAIDGGPEGEVAIHFVGDGGTFILGDALINLLPYGFALLPTKYCTRQKEMRRSLRQLLDYSFERLLFAHGMPLLQHARERLEALLS